MSELKPDKDDEGAIIHPEEAEMVETYVVEKVTLDKTRGDKGMWICELEHGFQIEFARGKIQPKKESVVEVYGDIDQEPRGIKIDNNVLFMRTLEEQVEHEAKVLDAQYKLAEERYEENKEMLTLRESALRPSMKHELDELRKEYEGARESEEQSFDVLFLEEEVTLCEYAQGLELLVDDEASLETFYMLPTVNKMWEIWAEMVAQRTKVWQSITQTPRAQWLLRFFHGRHFDAQLTQDQLLIIRARALLLIDERSDKRIGEVAQWKQASAELAQAEAATVATDPTTAAAYEERAAEVAQLREEGAQQAAAQVIEDRT